MSEEVSLSGQQQPQGDEQNRNDQVLQSEPQESAANHNNQDTSAPKHDQDVQMRMEEMEKEAAKLRELNSKLNTEVDNATSEEKKDIDSRSIYIGNVDYGATPLELQQHFSGCGVVNRVTIPLNKFSGLPKGYAYLEFGDIDAVNKAIATLDGSTFRDREIKVLAKRANVPGLSSTNRGQRGFFRGRGFRGAFRGRGPRGGRGFRGASRFTPY